ncbi:hypothetical protein ACLMJK_008804 [Lecanora helva]
MSTTRTGHHGPMTYDGQSQTDTAQKVPWYTENITSIDPAGRKLLEQYSKIAAEEVLPHVLRIRDEAFKVWPYACIGQVRFLSYTIPHHPYYEPTLTRLRAGATFLDAGCCFGQELRFLVHQEGIPGKQLYGFDLEQGFLDMGYELFRDRERLGAGMFVGNLLADGDDSAAPEAQQLHAHEGKMDIVHVASVLHSWRWDNQVRAAKRLVKLSKPQAGSMIIGNQMGSVNAGHYPMPTGIGYNYRHHEASMMRFWEQVGEETASKWKVESGLFLPAVVKENLEHSWAKSDPGLRMIWFMATRL